MTLRSAASGRERWRIAGLAGRPAVAQRIELILRNEAGVRYVKANSRTGSVLVEFDGDDSPLARPGIAQRIQETLAQTQDAAGGRRRVPVRLRSAVAGRQRWVIEHLRRQPALAALVERVLREEPGVTNVDANPVTGTVLILFEPEARITQAIVILRVSEAIERVAKGELVALPPRRRRASIPVPFYWVAAGALIAGPRLILGAAAGPLILGVTYVGAAAAASAGLLEYLRQHILEKTDTAPSLRRLLDYLKPHRRDIITAVACSVIRKVVDFGPPIFIGMAVDIAAGTPVALFSIFGITAVSAQIVLLGITAWVVYLIESGFEYAYKARWRLLAQEIQHRLRVDAYSHAQLVQLRYLEDESTGNLTTIINDNINQLQLFIDDGVNAILEIAINVVVIGIAFAFLAPQVAWIPLLPIPIIAWLVVRYHESIVPIYDEVHRLAGQVSTLLVNNFTGITTIRSFGTEQEERARLLGVSAEYVDVNRGAIHRFAAFEPITRLPVQTVFASLIVFGGRAVLTGALSEGAFATLLYLVPRFLFPFAYIGQTIDRYQRAMAAVQRVFELIDKPIGPEGGDVRLPRHQVRGEITFQEVGFAYHTGGSPVLNDFDLHIPAGQTIGIVGATGSGKTTLVKLLLRFYDADDGRILLDGHDLRDLHVRDLRAAIGLVSQDVFLFDGTVRENISYGTHDATAEDIERAAQLAEAGAFIEQLPEGLDTTVGERGLKLSGGQRQRLSVARAIVKNPPIFILDEATAALDNETEAAIQRSLARITHTRTTIIIAHRLSTIRHADRIVVLGKGGQIIESGTHEELLDLDGYYASLWRVQTGEAAETLT